MLYKIFSEFSESEWTVFAGHLRDGGRVKITVGPVDLPSLTPEEAIRLSEALEASAIEVAKRNTMRD